MPNDPPFELAELVRHFRLLRSVFDPETMWWWVGWIKDGIEVRVADKMTEYIANFLCLKLKEEISVDLCRRSPN